MRRSNGSLADRLTAAASTANDVTIINSAGTEVSTWDVLHDDALRTAVALQSLGLSPGQRVALLGETSRELVAAIEAVWLAGACVSVLPMPGRVRDAGTFSAMTQSKLRQLAPSLVLGDSNWLALARPDPEGMPETQVMDLRDLARLAERAGPGAFESPTPLPERLAILQFTSGSTSDPKGVMVTERCRDTNIEAIANGLDLQPDRDRIVSWLPLFHDMGLIGMLGLAMLAGTSLVLADSGTFAVQPRRWMEWMSEFSGTISCAPNTAYGIAAKSLATGGSYDLGQWRIAINGAEPIDVPTLERFVRAAGAHGFSPASAFCVYGLAEATLAVTFPDPGSGLQADSVDRVGLETANYAKPITRETDGSRRLALLGHPLADFELRVRKQSGDLAVEREIGELEVRGDSVTPGYLHGPGLPADGWLKTGDRAYLVGDQLVVCGRIKDIIIVAGRNLYPEDLERSVTAVDGIRPGNVAAFGIELTSGREAVVIAAECKSDTTDVVRQWVASAVRNSADITPHDVLLLEPGALPKTSSGKLQRSLCREKYLAGTL